MKSFLSGIIVNRKRGSKLSQFKYYKAWKKSLSKKASPITNEQPWLNFDAIYFLNKNLTLQSKIFEYGGGGSTLFFINRAEKVVTIEHNKEWFDTLSTVIKNKNYTNWEGIFIEAQIGNLVEFPNKANPNHYSSSDENFKNYNFKNYASFIDNYPNNYFDVVLIDGRSRPSCIKHSINKVKVGGFLILDNSDRIYYLEEQKEFILNNFSTIIDNFAPTPYTKWFTKTSIWRKK